MSVQSTSVDGGTLPSTPPSSTSSSPFRSSGPNSSTSRSAPGAGGPPGRLAEVEVSGFPVAVTSRAMPACEV